MRKLFVYLILIVSTIAHAQQTQSKDDVDSEAAARNVLQSFSDGKYNTVWDSLTSQWLKNMWTKDMFMSNFSIGRPKLGALVSTTRVIQRRFSNDPNTNFHGDGYVITFKSKYAIGEFYEQVGVIRDPDGKYRFSGIDGSPVPKDPE